MTDDEITYADVAEYEHLFTLAPPLILGAMIKTRVNLVNKFKPSIVDYLEKLTPEEKSKLNLILNTDTEKLQRVMFVAYKKTGKKQFYLLANPENREFVEMNINGIKELIDSLS